MRKPEELISGVGYIAKGPEVLDPPRAFWLFKPSTEMAMNELPQGRRRDSVSTDRALKESSDWKGSCSGGPKESQEIWCPALNCRGEGQGGEGHSQKIHGDCAGGGAEPGE